MVHRASAETSAANWPAPSADKYDNREIGMNSRLDTIQAAILMPKFKAFVDHEIDDVNRVAGWYTERLKDKFVTPTVLPGFVSSWAQYTILLDNRAARDAMQAKLKENGIPSMIYYPRGLHQQEAYKWMGLDNTMYPKTVEATDRCLSLPMHPYLKETEVDMICRVQGASRRMTGIVIYLSSYSIIV